MTTPKWIDPKISVGNILQMLMIIVAALTGFFNLQQGIASNDAKIDKVDTVLKLEISHIRESLDGIKTRLEVTGRRSQRTNRLPGPIRTTQ